jgi:4,5-dihydroxyphthalate decarboxylase
MTNPHITLSCGDYDRTRPLIDGTIPTPCFDLTVVPLPSGERHRRFVRNLEFDACELQIAQYLGLKSRGMPITTVVFKHRKLSP